MVEKLCILFGSIAISQPIRKLEVVRFAELNRNRAAERKYKVDRKSVREWRGKKQRRIEELRKSTSAGAKRQRLEGGGRKVTDSELKERCWN